MIELFARLVFYVTLGMVLLGLMMVAGLVYLGGLAIIWVFTNGITLARQIQSREADRIER